MATMSFDENNVVARATQSSNDNGSKNGKEKAIIVRITARANVVRRNTNATE